MKQSFVQVMALPVVAKVEPEDIVPLFEEILSRGQDVGRVGAPLPAVDQNDQSSGLPVRLVGMIAQQADAVAAVHDGFPRGILHGVSPHVSHGRRRRHGLKVRISRKKAGLKFHLHAQTCKRVKRRSRTTIWKVITPPSNGRPSGPGENRGPSSVRPRSG